MKSKYIGLAATFIAIAGMVGCSEMEVDASNENSNREVKASEQMDINKNSVGMEMRVTEKNQKALNKKQPAPQIDYSLERQNLIDRVERWNDPNKISYVYFLGANGNVITYHTVKGKISSVDSRLSTEDQIIADPNFDSGWSTDSAGGLGSLVVESPSEDGSYGTNGDGIFFFTTAGTYVEWNGIYHISDEPMTLLQEPVMMSKESEK